MKFKLFKERLFQVGEPAPFTVETISAGSGDVLVYLEDPNGHNEELTALANNDRNKTYR